MKKLLIFLLLFAFGFGAYCEAPPAPDGYEFWQTNPDGYQGYWNEQTFTTPIKLYFEPNDMWIHDTITDTMLYSNYLAPNNVSSLPLWITLPAGTYTISYWTVHVYRPILVDPPVITSSLSLSKITGQSFSYTITATGDPTISYGASNLPAGFTLSGSTISGTVPASNFSFDISATNGGGSDNKTVNVTVSSGVAPLITSNLSVDADAGVSFSYEIVASGTQTITYGVSGLPSFLFFDNDNTVYGTIPTGQTVDFTYTVTASNPYGSDSKLVTVHAIPGVSPVITSPVIVSATSGTAFSYTITASGDPTIAFTASDLPSYLSYSNNVVSGTLPVSLVPVSFSFTVGASNLFGSDSKVININATAGSNGQFDSDDDVPAINAMKEAIVATLTANSNYLFANLTDIHNAVIEVGSYTLSIKDLLTTLLPDIESALAEIETSVYQISENTGMIADDTIIIRDDVSIIKTNIDTIKTDTGIVKTQVTEINSKMENIADLISLMNDNSNSQTLAIESLSGVLNQSLAVQQDQLITQNSILDLLDQIANPVPVPNPDMPDNPEDPPNVTHNIDFTFDKDDNSGDLQKYSKTFPMFDSAFRERQGVLDYTFRVPLSQVTPLLDDRYVNFCQGTLGDFVSGLRAILSCIMFYFTLKYWFLAVKRITD